MPRTTAGTKARVRTTVRMPSKLYDEARKFVDRELVPAENINDFFVAAISAYVNLLHRKQVDAEFAGMSQDPSYQKEAHLIAKEFSQSDWQALEIAEKESVEA